ncbi:response regulator [Halomicroarcula sp. GCM10025710]
MTTDQLRNFDGETVRLSRTVLRGSLRAADNSAPLLRTESADPSADSRIEVPVPLAKLREERQIRVLHVDDDPDLGETVGMFLERIDEDLTVVTETSAVAALGHVREGDVDCIVSDYQMPNTDGLELLGSFATSTRTCPLSSLQGREARRSRARPSRPAPPTTCRRGPAPTRTRCSRTG